MYTRKTTTPKMPGIPTRNYTRGPKDREAIEADELDAAAFDIELDLDLEDDEEDEDVY